MVLFSGSSTGFWTLHSRTFHTLLENSQHVFAAVSDPHRVWWRFVPSVRSTDLQTVKRELTQIKHKLDFLLESLERMEKEHNRKFGEEVLAANRTQHRF